MDPETKSEPALSGILTRAGTFLVREEETTGFVVSCSREELAAVTRLRMYQRVVILPAELVDDWTVRASDYDRLAAAARWLRRACKDRLPPGQYDKLSEECRAIDALFSQLPTP